MAGNDNDNGERQYVADVDALRARIDALVTATAAVTARIERIDETAETLSPRELRSQLFALVSLISAANGCVADAVRFVEGRLSRMQWPKGKEH